MVSGEETYRLWLEKVVDDPDLTEELRALDPRRQPKELEDRFARELAFGTGGLRGIMGAGPGRIEG